MIASQMTESFFTNSVNTTVFACLAWKLVVTIKTCEILEEVISVITVLHLPTFSRQALFTVSTLVLTITTLLTLELVSVAHHLERTVEVLVAGKNLIMVVESELVMRQETQTLHTPEPG